MTNHARIRKELRPHGMVAIPCHNCAHFSDCGGIEPERPLFDCFFHFCNPDCGKNGCDKVCPYNPKYFEYLQEINGLRFDDLPSLRQDTISLPRYIPLIHHASCRLNPLNCRVVALDTYQVFRHKDGKYSSLADDAEQLRKAFCLSPKTQIILRGTAKDVFLERYWSYRRRDAAPQTMAKLGISLVIGPNFSHPLDVVRTDNLANRKRQLICLDEFSRAGLSPVPHLSAVQRGDWRFWQNFLTENTAITYVAVEFQTGNKNPKEGRKVIDRVASIQDKLGRGLHFLAIGAGQFVEYVSARFDCFSLLDSKPFMNAVNRHRFDKTAGKHPWRKTVTAAGQSIDRLMEDNIYGYAAWIEERSRLSGQNGRHGNFMIGNNRVSLPLSSA